jgi:hypothetical protein
MEKMTLTQAMDLFDESLDEIIDALATNIDTDVDELEVAWKKAGMPDNWIAREVKKLTIEQKLGQQIRTLRRLTSRQEAKNNPAAAAGTITDEMIAKAKEFPIEDMYDGRLRKVGERTYTGLCPFHNEKTPSFQIKKNRFTCYGCNAFGDAIDFYQKINRASFASAVRTLAQ